jgi:hypothetical protein
MDTLVDGFRTAITGRCDDGAKGAGESMSLNTLRPSVFGRYSPMARKSYAYGGNVLRDRFGKLRDKFGTSWMILALKPQTQ